MPNIKFQGRADNLLYFTDDTNTTGVVIDSDYGVVVASGKSDLLSATQKWRDGEYDSASVDTASASLSVLSATVSAPTGRLYTVPKGVQKSAARAARLKTSVGRGSSPVASYTAGLLASGGQLSFDQVRHIALYFSRHEGVQFTDDWNPSTDGKPSTAQITYNLYGGDAANTWTATIIAREADKALTADGIVIPDDAAPSGDPFQDAFNLDPDAGPEFLARVVPEGTSIGGSAIDRLYKIDIDGSVYVWDDSAWTNLGQVGVLDIYDYDSALDSDPSALSPIVRHVIVDPGSAVVIGAKLDKSPWTAINIEDVDPEEAGLVYDAINEIDWDMLDAILVEPITADATPGVYSPAERSQNAEVQPRTSDGRFATVGSQISIKSTNQTGQITAVNSQTGNVTVALDDGSGNVMIPASGVVSSNAAPGTVPTTTPTNVTPIDTSGILAEPRTPINSTIARIPGTLPALGADDLHAIINNFPAWVQSQRNSFSPLPTAQGVGVQVKNSTDIGPTGRRIEAETGQTIHTDAYTHPLLKDWLKQTGPDGIRNSIWYQPEFATVSAQQAIEAQGPQEVGKPITPDTSDVQPLYLAIVADDDPQAVTQLISLVPASTTSTQPQCFSRQDGDWVADPQTLANLQSATPPPVVPLNADDYQDVLSQVDDTQAGSSGESADSAPDPIMSSATIFELVWGPLDTLKTALTAAGGLDRNRGQAENLRHYWEHGKGALKIRWNTPGDWTRCVRNLSKYLGPRSAGYCSLRHKEMTGMWPGDKRNREMGIRTEEAIISSSMLPHERAHELHARIHNLSVSAITADAFPAPDPMAVGSPFVIPLVLPIDTETGDGRFVADDAELALRNLPFPLLWQYKTSSGHDGSIVVGRIDSMDITPTGVRNAQGIFDTSSAAVEVQRLIRGGFIKGVSADMDNFKAQEVELADDESGVSDQKLQIDKTRIMAVTIVAKPAFQECQIFLIDDPSLTQEDTEVIPDGVYVSNDTDPEDLDGFVAAGYVAENIPVAPPKTWFEDPHLQKLTPITVEDDGKVFGHIASWNTSHIGFPNKSLNPPRSKSNYSYFHTGVLRTEEGRDVNVGQLTLAGGHAGLEFSARQAIKHYDDTASAIADVHAGEDVYGIWVSGSVRPGTTPEQIRVLRASAPSGDWRPIRGHLELVAVCQVNVPGFPVARTLVASGMPMALVAAGAADVARLRGDSIDALQVRIAKLEQFTNAELSTKVESARTKFAALKAAKNSELSEKAEAAATRVAALTDFSYIPQARRDKLAKDGKAMPDGSYPIANESDLRKAVQASGRAKNPTAVKRHIIKRARALGKSDLIPDEWTKTSASSVSEYADSMRSRIAERAQEFALSDAEKKEQERKIEDIARAADPHAIANPNIVDTPDANPTTDETNKEGMPPKYTPKTQPRDENGKFRLILARLRENLGTTGNQQALDQMKKVENLDNVGNYQEASKQAADLITTLDSINAKSLDPHTVKTLKEVSRELSGVVANLPLPFDDQSQKIRFSDLPPVLQQLMRNLIGKVEQKYGTKKAGKQTEDVDNFMRGSGYYSQSDVSSQMNHLVHLLSS